MNEFSTYSFWISLIGTMAGIISLCISIITMKNTEDIKTVMYKKKLQNQLLTELPVYEKEIEGRISYLNKDKTIDKIAFAKQFEPIILFLRDTNEILSKKQQKQLQKIRNKYDNIIEKDDVSSMEQLQFLLELKQFCDKLIICFKEN